MSKVTSKLQVTIPKVVANQYGIKPGDEIEFLPAGESIRVRTVRNRTSAREVRLDQPEAPGLRWPRHDLAYRLKLFDETTAQLMKLARKSPTMKLNPKSRGWKREDAYAERLDRYPR